MGQIGHAEFIRLEGFKHNLGQYYLFVKNMKKNKYTGLIHTIQNLF